MLLIDDDVILSQTYRTEFGLSGFKVLQAFDGQTGLRLAKEAKPDVILLDILMPMMTGLDVLKKIKSDEEISQIPVIILTNIEEDETVREALDSGANDFITKYRVTPAGVASKIKEIIAA